MDRTERIERSFGVFEIADLARVLVVRDTMKMFETTYEDLEEYLDHYKKVVESGSKITRNGIPRGSVGNCPDCGRRLMPSNLPHNIRGWRVRLMCTTGWDKDDPEGICGYERLSKQTIMQIERDVLIKAAEA